MPQINKGGKFTFGKSRLRDTEKPEDIHRKTHKEMEK